MVVTGYTQRDLNCLHCCYTFFYHVGQFEPPEQLIKISSACIYIISRTHSFFLFTVGSLILQFPDFLPSPKIIWLVILVSQRIFAFCNFLRLVTNTIILPNNCERTCCNSTQHFEIRQLTTQNSRHYQGQHNICLETKKVTLRIYYISIIVKS